MFEALLGSKFSKKCKYCVKCISSRVQWIRKKRQATVKFLKKDVADLLANGHDLNAFGRIDALIVEINHTSCYDMIEQYCQCILSQLPSIKKQRECPQEAMEAVSTLIFAAARFSDLPELYNLRLVFTKRYGSQMEPSVNSEFVEKVQKKSFSTDRKLRLMQDIAEESSMSWDSRAFRQKLSNPSAPPSEQPKRSINKTEGRYHVEISGKNAAVNPRKEAIFDTAVEGDGCNGETRYGASSANRINGGVFNADVAVNGRREAVINSVTAVNSRDGVVLGAGDITVDGRKETATKDAVPRSGEDRENASVERRERRSWTFVQKQLVRPVTNDGSVLNAGGSFNGRKEAAVNGDIRVNGRRETVTNDAVSVAGEDREVAPMERREHPSWTFVQKQLVRPVANDRSVFNAGGSFNGTKEVVLNGDIAVNGRKETVANGAISHAGEDRAVASVERKEPTSWTFMRKQLVQPEPRDIHMIPAISGRSHYPAEKIKVPVASKETENMEPVYDNAGDVPFVKSKERQNSIQKDGWIKPKVSQDGICKHDVLKEGTSYSMSPIAQEEPGLIDLERQSVAPTISRDVEVVNKIPPATKLQESRNVAVVRVAVYKESLRDEKVLDPTVQVNSKDARPFNMIPPPYTRPRFRNPSTDDAKLSDVLIKSSCTADHERSDDGNKAKPVSVRRHIPKPLLAKEYDNATNDAKPIGKQADDDSYAEENLVGNQRKAAAEEMNGDVNDERHAHSSGKHGGRRSSAHSSGKHEGRRSIPTYSGDRDEEEAAMDRLLLHFSKKGMNNDPSRRRARLRAPPGRADAGRVRYHRDDRPHVHI